MSNQVNLPENLTIHHINDQFSEIKGIIQSETDQIVFDAGAIEAIDTSGVQMLLALIEDLNSRQVDFSWQNPNDLLRESAKNLGLSEQLQLQ